jgi:hypothetical protein
MIAGWRRERRVDRKADRKANILVGSSHECRLADGKVGGQKGRRESRPVRQAQKAGIPICMSWPAGRKGTDHQEKAVRQKRKQARRSM